MTYDIDKNLTFKHYKEPLRAIPKGEGFGFYGAILMTKDMDKIQCHVCGETFRSLSGHLATHGMNGKQYKEKYQLAYETALVSESFRFELKHQTLEYFRSLSEEEKEAMKQRQREAMRSHNYDRVQPKQQLETKNKRGTCPDQLLDKIVKVAHKMGRVPSKKEFIQECGTQRYVHLIYKTFGSWVEAVQLAGFKPKEREFHGFTDEQLLNLLKSFYKQYGSPPSYSDFSRGLLPSMDSYRRFGGIVEARKLAGVPEYKSKRWSKQ
jgi:ROS/MUCR transcriptional regulator protein/Homing endonuclease associated repeat